MYRRKVTDYLEKTKVLLGAFLKPITNTETQAQKAKRNWVWIVVVVVVIVGGRLLLFEVEGNPLQLPLKARDWTGFGESYDNNVSEVVETGTETDGKITKKVNKITTTQKKLEPAKTLWDWMGLLLAPATLAGLGFLFQSSQERAKRDKEEADKKRDADQQREQALQTYFDQLSALLVDKKLLRNLPDKQKESTNSEAQPSSDTPTPKIDVEDPEIDAEAALGVVKAKTLALFRLFDNADPVDMTRKASVLAFWGDTGLLKALTLDLSFSHWEKANLSTAKLRGALLYNALLHNADLSHADLSHADLNKAQLYNADLSYAILRGADLSHAILRGAILRGAILRGASLNNRVQLYHADLSGADLSGADLSGAILGGAILRGADLRRADLSGAILLGVDLSGADLSGADLSGADLSGAILLGVDLTQASNLFQAQLEGELKPFLCKVKLPKEFKIDCDRDCKKLLEVLQERYPNDFKDQAAAQKFIDSWSRP